MSWRFRKRFAFVVIAAACLVILGASLRKTSKVSEEKPRQTVGCLIRNLTNSLPSSLKVCIIEPRILWALVSNSSRQLLRRKSFDIKKFEGEEGLISLAVFSNSIPLFHRKATQTKLATSGFKCSTVKSQVQSWMLTERQKVEDKETTSHIFCSKNGVHFHIVVFFTRHSYLWHWKVPSGSIPTLRNTENALFFSDSSYDWFKYQKSKVAGIYVPENIPRFLLQVQTSRYVPCLGITNVSMYKNHTSDQAPLDLFSYAAISVIRQLEIITSSSLTRFWLSSGTLLGWYRDCGLIPYTSDMDFAAAAEDITENLIYKFKTNSDLRFRAMIGKVEEDLELTLFYCWLQVDLFFMYQDSDTGTCHAGGHNMRLGYSFRYIFPKFSLCSGELLGLRITVPCKPSEIIEAEYGENWRNPDEDWHYQLSPRNIHGRRYWDKNEVEKYESQFE